VSAIARGAIAAAASATLFAAPLSAETFVGPENSFTLDFDGDWTVIQAQNRGGVVCTQAACGQDRVFCIVMPRSDEAATPGKALPDMLVNRFGDRLVAMPPAGMKSEFVQKFAPRTIGDVAGSWAEIRSSGDKPALRFGLFLFAAPGFDIALSCGAPDAKWAEHEGKIEKLLASARVAAAATPPAPPHAEPAPQAK
jgi:hypothetical protein